MNGTNFGSYLTSSKIPAQPADTLVVHCSDFRVQAGIHDFVDNGLKLNHNFDLLAIPGGPQALTIVEYLPKFSWAGWKWTRFLVDRHVLKRFILIAHQDCKWYESLPLHLHASRTPRERQEQDLRRVHNKLEGEFPGLNVELYYAGWNSDEQVFIEPVLP